MRRLEGFGELESDRQGFLERNGAPLEPYGEVLAFGELHDEEVNGSGWLRCLAGR